MWTGIKSAFEAVLAVFTPLEPLISAIGSEFSGLSGVNSSVIGWIAELIAPVQGSTEDMQRWAASGESLGQALGTVFRVLLSPIMAYNKNYNQLWVKLFRWTYTGEPLTV